MNIAVTTIRNYSRSIREEAEERGIRGQVSPTSPYSYLEWQIKLDILEMTVEQVLQDER